MLKIGDFVGFAEPVLPPVIDPSLWYILRVHPNREIQAAERLARLGMTVYVPRETRSRRTCWNRRRVITAPIFPGLMFIASHDANLMVVRGYTDAVVAFVRFGEHFASAGPDIMAEIRAIEDRLNLPMGRRKYAIGQDVEVTDGPFGMWIGKIERLEPHGRIKVLLDILGRQVPVKLDETQIAAV